MMVLKISKWILSIALSGAMSAHSLEIANEFMQAAIEEAEKGMASGGIPIGSVLVYEGKIIGRGHNQRMQQGSAIHHGEMNCLENAGRLPAEVYQNATLYTTLSPCPMCSGAIRLYKIKQVVIGENETFMGDEELLRNSGVSVVVLDNERCKELMRQFILEHPEVWNEDIGVVHSSH
jgi:cytosine/creatinine deaminase